ncbi:hypothetical protein AVEN_73444-1 [Araneus ventricosus]|uniref:Uncharacterized protein n=1 Tax=Araneus ventricosus TaxID=182803 RepID=A0A4Y2GL36_ARAVE|nr:hypothetical protein AVEN_73444-1 [Araneus ventricosus]
MGLVSCNSSWWGRVTSKTGTEHNGALWQEEKSDRFTIIDQLKESEQIAILVCSKVAAILLCKSASLRQECKLETSLKQVNANEIVTTRQTCHKLVMSNSMQTIVKTEYEDNLGFEPPTYHVRSLSP